MLTALVTHLHASDSQSILQVLRHAERHLLRNAQTLAFLKAHVVIDVYHLRTDKKANCTKRARV